MWLSLNQGHRAHHHLVLPICARDNLTWAEGMGVTHQDLLLGLQTLTVEGNRVVTADACTVGPAEAIVSEAFAVEFQAARLAAIARFRHWRLRKWHKLLWMTGCRWYTKVACLWRYTTLRDLSGYSRLMVVVAARRHVMGSTVDSVVHTRHRIVVSIVLDFATVDLKSLRERVFNLWWQSWLSHLHESNLLHRREVVLSKLVVCRLGPTCPNLIYPGACRGIRLWLWCQ